MSRIGSLKVLVPTCRQRLGGQALRLPSRRCVPVLVVPCSAQDSVDSKRGGGGVFAVVHVYQGQPAQPARCLLPATASDMPATYERGFGVVGMGGSRRKAGERSGEAQWSPSMAWSPPRMLRWRTAMCQSWTSRFSIITGTGAQHASLAAFGSQAVCHSAT